MQMKQILILEDNDLTRKKLVKILETIEPKVSILPFSTQEEALGFALTHRIDLYLVDIILRPKERNDFSGIQFVEKIKECPSCGTAEVVFITALAGLEVDLLHRVHCYDYIEKPIDEERVKRIVTEILGRGERAAKLPERIYFRNDGISYPVDVAEISYAVCQNRELSIYTGEECIRVPNLPLKKFLEQVKDSVFLSPMKGTAVNISYIESIDYVNQYIYLKGINEPVCMGSVQKRRFRSEYEAYVKRGYKL